MLTPLPLHYRAVSQAFVVVGDYNGHCGLGVKCAKEVATAIRGACCCALVCRPALGFWVPGDEGLCAWRAGLPAALPSSRARLAQVRAHLSVC